MLTRTHAWVKSNQSSVRLKAFLKLFMFHKFTFSTMNYFMKAKKKKKWIFSLKIHEKQLSLSLIFQDNKIFSLPTIITRITEQSLHKIKKHVLTLIQVRYHHSL